LTTQPASVSGSTSQQFSGADDLLSDPEPEESKKISGESTELANLSNQIKSLANQTQETHAKRATIQNEVNHTMSQKQTFEQRLSQLRTLYEKEAEDTRALEDHLRKSRQDTEKLRGECMTLEGKYRDIQAEHQEVSLALQKDQQENTDLKERIRLVNAEIARLRPEIDKLKSAARQQKGLVAIYKKQLLTAEEERDKLKAEAEELSKASEESRRQSNASSSASPTAQIASPAPFTSSGNNPFFKRSASTDIMGAFASPPSRGYTGNASDHSFDPAGSNATSPPVTSFTQQYTGTSAASASSAPTPASSSPNVSRQGTLTAELPAPPESRQISSSFLPFPEHTESLSSSRQVSPPASRGESSVKESQQLLSAGATTSQGASLPGAFPGDSDKDTPGATPNLAGVKVTPPVEDDAKASSNPTRASNPFAGMDNAKAKEEFDNAFAAFSAASTTQEKSTTEGTKSKSAFDSEFPPISELQRDDESDSESERGGFDDDFATTWPEQQRTTAPKAPEGKADESKETVDKR
jgi:epidermal growth factor receptor substrate 15